ncbi:site-specific integrase, partial [Bacteroides ovatus]
MGFLWLFHKSLKKATEFNTSLPVLMPSGFDETIECKPPKTKVMKQGTMNILFFVLKTKLLKNGEAPVLMRITINGDYDDVRIQRSVPLNLWNAAK